MAILDTLFGTPQSTMLGGLLGNEQMDKLRQQALTTGLINTAIGYLAQPKNQRFGSALPYLARAAVAGQQGAQGVYDDALRNYQSQLQMSEMQRKQEQQKKLQELIGNIEDPQERLYAQLAPEQYVTQKLKPRQQQAFAILTPEQAGAYGLPVDRGQRYQMTENGVQLISGTEGKEKESWTDPYMLGGQMVQKSNLTGQIRQAVTAPAQTNVTVGKQETEEAKTVGKGFGEQYNEIQKAGIGAQRTIDRATRLNQLLTDVETGKLTPVGKEISATARSLGFKVNEKLPNLEAATALSNEMALELRNPSGGAGMPGALSDKDREFLVSMTPGIAQTPEGRKLITESMIKLAKRNQEVAKIARDYRKRTGTLDEGFYAELEAFSAQNPLFETMKTQKAPRNKKDILKQYGID